MWGVKTMRVEGKVKSAIATVIGVVIVAAVVVAGNVTGTAGTLVQLFGMVLAAAGLLSMF